MSQVLTREEGRALLAQQKGPKNARKPPLLPRTPSPAPKEPREPGEAGRSGETALPGIPVLPKPDSGTPGGPCSWLLNAGLTCIALAAAHFGDRYRVVLTCPKDPGLLKALLAAAETYYSTPKA